MSNEKIVIEIPSVDTWNITALRGACKRNKVKGYTKMDKEQLVEAVKGIIANMGRDRNE